MTEIEFFRHKVWVSTNWVCNINAKASAQFKARFRRSRVFIKRDLHCESLACADKL